MRMMNHPRKGDLAPNGDGCLYKMMDVFNSDPMEMDVSNPEIEKWCDFSLIASFCCDS